MRRVASLSGSATQWGDGGGPGCHTVSIGGVGARRPPRLMGSRVGRVIRTGTVSSEADYASRPGRLTTIASWLLRAITTTASVSVGFSSRCGVNGGTKT